MFTREIYLYRWALDGRAFYVGSAWEAVERDAAHRRGVLYVDHIVRTFGRDKFTIEIIDLVQGHNKADVSRHSKVLENKHIIFHQTTVEYGGGNKELNETSNKPCIINKLSKNRMARLLRGANVRLSFWCL